MLRDAKKTAASLCEWIRTYMAAAGESTKVVIGLSGGKDSSVTAALCVAALGCERVIGAMRRCKRFLRATLRPSACLLPVI